MVLGPKRHNDQMPKHSYWPLAVGLAAGVALDALFGDPRHGHPVAAFGRAAAALEARDYADSRRRGAAHTAVAGGCGRDRGVGGHRCPFAPS